MPGAARPPTRPPSPRGAPGAPRAPSIRGRRAPNPAAAASSTARVATRAWPAKEPSMSSNPAILLAAEDHALRAFLADNLSADGYRVLVAEDKPGALALLAAKHPALAILDINGDTLGLLDAVRAGDGLAGHAHPDTPLIVLTARADELARVRLYDRGSDDVVCKPFSYPELR
ncbi:MAG: two-component system, OmpR family, response regulator, partial [Solirubrobacteraceae bacterium]|nr:two-component system, OmpR family, response regulator [Solirubrobacteraceae bacterium]